MLFGISKAVIKDLFQTKPAHKSTYTSMLCSECSQNRHILVYCLNMCRLHTTSTEATQPALTVIQHQARLCRRRSSTNRAMET